MSPSPASERARDACARYGTWSVDALLARHREYASHEHTRDADKDARLMLFYETALRETELMAHLEKGAEMSSACAFLFYAFVSTALTERASQVLAGLTRGVGFGASDASLHTVWDDETEPLNGWDLCLRERWNSVEGVEGTSHGPLLVKPMKYRSSVVFTKLLMHCVGGSKYERQAWFDRLFESTNHYAAILKAAMGNTAVEGIWESFARLYTHLRLLETTMHYVPESFLEPMNAERTADTLGFILSLTQQMSGSSIVMPEYLCLAMFGIVTRDARVEALIVQRLWKMSGMKPDFALLSRASFYENAMVWCSKLDERAKRAAIRSMIKTVTEGQRRIETIPLERDLSEEAPDEFLDPVTGSLMENPVLLPASKQYVDISTIERFAKQGFETDPFTGTPLNLKERDVDTALKQKIHTWRCDVLTHHRSNRQ